METVIENRSNINVRNWQSANRNLQDASLRESFDAEQWNLLEKVLGERLSEVHPRIVSFFSNPTNPDVKSKIELHTLPSKFWARVVTFVLSQGLYESHLQRIPTRFFVSRRADGAMRFVREFDCENARRVFDSDFVVRDVDGTQKFFEVFEEIGVDVEMDFEPTNDGGIVNKCKRFSWRGLRIPMFGLECEFRGRVEKNKQLHFTGYLRMNPKTRFGKFFAYNILRRPKLLACLHYYVPFAWDRN